MREAYETASSSRTITIDRDKEISASFIDQRAFEGFTPKQDIVHAQPGGKKLKHDVFTPNGAQISVTVPPVQREDSFG